MRPFDIQRDLTGPIDLDRIIPVKRCQTIGSNDIELGIRQTKNMIKRSQVRSNRRALIGVYDHNRPTGAVDTFAQERINVIGITDLSRTVAVNWRGHILTREVYASWFTKGGFTFFDRMNVWMGRSICMGGRKRARDTCRYHTAHGAQNEQEYNAHMAIPTRSGYSLTKFFLISETGTIRYQIINVVERIGHRDLNGDK